LGEELRRLRERRKAIRELSDLYRNPENALLIHYSCESFYDRTLATSPRITSVAIRNLASGQTNSFSIHQVAERNGTDLGQINQHYDRLERQMLDEFFEFIRTHQGYRWIHWNMRDVNYGFQALEHRFRVLGGTPTVVDDSRKWDLASNLIRMFGVKYIGHPRLDSLMRKNKISALNFLSGEEEAAAFVAGEYVRLHQSTLRKVDVLSNIAERTINNTLETHATWQDKYGVSYRVIPELIKKHWIWSMIVMLFLLLRIGVFVYEHFIR